MSTDQNGEGVNFEFPARVDLNNTNCGVFVAYPILDTLVSVDSSNDDRDIVSDLSNRMTLCMLELRILSFLNVMIVLYFL